MKTINNSYKVNTCYGTVPDLYVEKNGAHGYVKDFGETSFG